MRKVLSGITAFGAVVAFIFLLGTAGGIDTDSIDFATGTKEMVIFTAIFAVLTIITMLLNHKEEE